MADEENPGYLIFPNEIWLYLFKYFTMQSLMLSRQVCKQWKYLIDDMLSGDEVWRINCAKEFPRSYMYARRVTPYCETWFDLYKSLYRWRFVASAKETIDEFGHAISEEEETRSIMLLDKGFIGILKQYNLFYSDVQSLEICEDRPQIEGMFIKYYERGDIFLVLGEHLDLLISRWQHSPGTKNYNRQEMVAMFHQVKLFIVHGKDLYYANTNNQLFKFGIYHESPLTMYQTKIESDIFALSFYNDVFHILTIDRMISAYIDDKFESQVHLDSVSNVVHTLWQYNFLEDIDWRILSVWLCHLGIKIPDGPLLFICSLRIYGDTFIIGSNCGAVLIYYKPFINGELNLFDTPPTRQFNFAQRSDIPVLSMSPILKVECVETKEGHKIIIAMPRKIAIVNLTYERKSNTSRKELVPYKKPVNLFQMEPAKDNLVN